MNLGERIDAALDPVIEWVGRIGIVFAGLALIAFLIGGGVVIWHIATDEPPVTFELRVSEWACAASSRHPGVKGITYTRCDLWERR